MSLPTPPDDSWPTKAAAALALISVTAAVWFSLQAHRLADLRHLAAWVTEWARGAHVYGSGSVADYPPWAIVTLSPLSRVPTDSLPVVWVVVNLILLVWIARRLSGQRALVFLLLVAAGAMRTLNQFSLLSLALGLAGIGTRGALGPVWLGLALIKPQIGGVFWLLSLWQRQWRRSLAALAVPAVLTLAYAMHAHVGLVTVIGDYTRVIAGLYGGSLGGQTEVTRWLLAIGSSLLLVPIAVTAAVVAFAPYARQEPLTGLAFASLFGTRHLSYDFVLLLPALAQLQGAWLWLATLVCVADPSAVIGMVVPGSWLARHADRALLVAVWAWGAWYLALASLRRIGANRGRRSDIK